MMPMSKSFDLSEPETVQLTRARSYISFARFMDSESWNLSTSPCSVFTLSCSSLFFFSSSLSVSTKIWYGDRGTSSRRDEDEWKEETRYDDGEETRDIGRTEA